MAVVRGTQVAMPASDPLLRLEHDHAHLGALLDALRAAMGNADRIEIGEALRSLRDDLFAHFALEEEGLFPLVVRELPDMEGKLALVVESHDRICGAVSRMLHVIESERGDLEALGALLDRFEEAYGVHARDELDLLRALDTRLDGAQRAAVARVLREL